MIMNRDSAENEAQKKVLYELSERDGKVWERPFYAPRSIPWRPSGETSIAAAARELRAVGCRVTRRRSGL